MTPFNLYRHDEAPILDAISRSFSFPSKSLFNWKNQAPWKLINSLSLCAIVSNSLRCFFCIEIEFTDIPDLVLFLGLGPINWISPNRFVKQSTVYSSPGRYSVIIYLLPSFSFFLASALLLIISAPIDEWPISGFMKTGYSVISSMFSYTTGKYASFFKWE